MRQQPDQDEAGNNHLAAAVSSKAARKLRARSRRRRGVWYGLAMYGVVGWSVALPTLVGIAAGLLLDTLVPVSFSWTLVLLFAGLILGLHSAWRWVAQEMHDEEEDRPEEDK